MTPQLKRAYNLGRAYAVKSAQILDMMPSTGQLTAVGGLQGLAGGGILGGIAGGAVGGIRGAANHKKDSENSMIQDILFPAILVTTITKTSAVVNVLVSNLNLGATSVAL